MTAILTSLNPYNKASNWFLPDVSLYEKKKKKLLYVYASQTLSVAAKHNSQLKRMKYFATT